MKHSSTTSGLTLIDILIILGILGALAAMFLPATSVKRGCNVVSL